MAAETHDRPFAIVGRGTLFDGAAYWATLLGVYLMVGGLMFYSGKGKLFDDDGNAPQGIKDQFKGTFIDTFPGTDAAWVILGLLEFGVFLLLLASLCFLEFLPHRPKLVPAARARGGAPHVRVPRVRPDRDEPVLGHRVALHVLRVDGGDPDPRQPHAAEPARPLARRAWRHPRLVER